MTIAKHITTLLNQVNKPNQYPQYVISHRVNNERNGYLVTVSLDYPSDFHLNYRQTTKIPVFVEHVISFNEVDKFDYSKLLDISNSYVKCGLFVDTSIYDNISLLSVVNAIKQELSEHLGKQDYYFLFERVVKPKREIDYKLYIYNVKEKFPISHTLFTTINHLRSYISNALSKE